MDHPLADRRRDARFSHAGVAELRATVRPGCPVSVVDLSAGGVLVEAGRPLRPGARVQLQLADVGRSLLVPAQVLRCTVAAVDPDRGVVYRGALRFEGRCSASGEAHTRAGSAEPGTEVLRLVAGGHAIPSSVRTTTTRPGGSRK